MARSLLDLKSELEKLLYGAGNSVSKFLAPQTGTLAAAGRNWLSTPLPQSLQKPVSFVNRGLNRVSQAAQTQPMSFVFPPLRPVVKYAAQNVGELASPNPQIRQQALTSIAIGATAAPIKVKPNPPYSAKILKV